MKTISSMPQLQHGRLLSELCTFGIGGPAHSYIEVRSIEEMQWALNYSTENKHSFFILGKGSNCLFDDRGLAGLVIHNKIDFKEELSNGLLRVGGGYNFSLLGSQTARKGWSGLEFASGIPGSVGGAVFMNAGANGRETCDSLVSVDFMDFKGTIQSFKKEELQFSHRRSAFQSMRGAIVGATFAFTLSSDAREKQKQIINYRKNTQPYGEKSAGCIFRNPDCGHAGTLIDKSGLKGVNIGGAKISEIHANFIINDKHAKTGDVLNLIEHVKKVVKEQTGVDLENEVRHIPYNIGSV